MSAGMRILSAVAIGIAIGVVLGIVGGLMTNEGMDFPAGVLMGAAGGLSAGVMAMLLRPKTE